MIVVLWLGTDYLTRAFHSGRWSLLGFFFLPTTTIAYAIAQNALATTAGDVSAGGIVLIVLGVAIDLGLLGGGGRGSASGRAAPPGLTVVRSAHPEDASSARLTVPDRPASSGRHLGLERNPACSTRSLVDCVSCGARCAPQRSARSAPRYQTQACDARVGRRWAASRT